MKKLQFPRNIPWACWIHGRLRGRSGKFPVGFETHFHGTHFLGTHAGSWRSLGRKKEFSQKTTFCEGPFLMQSFEKARNIEARIVKKLRIRSSAESSVRWGSEQDSLQGDEELV